MRVHYLEIVSPDVSALCDYYAALLGTEFGPEDPLLGGARTAPLEGGGHIGIRPPMRDSEQPVVRPYTLVDDLSAAVSKAKEAGLTVALPPMELGHHGSCAILMSGDSQIGLWQT